MQLALETSTNICSVAFRDSEGEVHEKRTEVRKSHSEKLFLFIEELMQEHGFRLDELDALVVSRGPGSYTGLRISASAVKGLLFQLDIPLYAANTLASFAYAGKSRLVNSTGSIHGIVDARRVHLYHQKFVKDGDRVRALSKVRIIPIKEFQEDVKEGDVIVGTGLPRIDETVLDKTTVLGTAGISAVSLLGLMEEDREGVFVEKVEVEQFEPSYYTSGQVQNSSK